MITVLIALASSIGKVMTTQKMIGRLYKRPRQPISFNLESTDLSQEMLTDLETIRRISQSIISIKLSKQQILRWKRKVSALLSNVETFSLLQPMIIQLKKNMLASTEFGSKLPHAVR